MFERYLLCASECGRCGVLCELSLGNSSKAFKKGDGAFRYFECPLLCLVISLGIELDGAEELEVSAGLLLRMFSCDSVV